MTKVMEDIITDGTDHLKKFAVTGLLNIAISVIIGFSIVKMIT